MATMIACTILMLQCSIADHVAKSAFQGVRLYQDLSQVACMRCALCVCVARCVVLLYGSTGAMSVCVARWVYVHSSGGVVCKGIKFMCICMCSACARMRMNMYICICVLVCVCVLARPSTTNNASPVDARGRVSGNFVFSIPPGPAFRRPPPIPRVAPSATHAQQIMSEWTRV